MRCSTAGCATPDHCVSLSRFGSSAPARLCAACRRVAGSAFVARLRWGCV